MEGEPDAGLPLALDEPIHKVGAFSPTSRSSSSGPDRCVRSCVLYASRSPLSGSDPKVPSRPPSSNEMVRIDKAAYCGRARPQYAALSIRTISLLEGGRDGTFGSDPDSGDRLA